jgi:hypothetical protein
MQIAIDNLLKQNKSMNKGLNLFLKLKSSVTAPYLITKLFYLKFLNFLINNTVMINGTVMYIEKKTNENKD